MKFIRLLQIRIGREQDVTFPQILKLHGIHGRDKESQHGEHHISVLPHFWFKHGKNPKIVKKGRKPSMRS